MQIDMDTIEVSNLNRQLLFRQSHVGQSKAKVSILFALLVLSLHGRFPGVQSISSIYQLGCSGCSLKI